MRITPPNPCDDYCTSPGDAAIISEDWLDHCDRMEEAPIVVATPDHPLTTRPEKKHG